MNFLKKLAGQKPLRFYLLLLYLVGSIGFVAGSLLFWGPIRWTIDYFQQEGASDKTESLIIKFYIVLILLFASAISYLLSKRYWESEKRNKNLTIYLPLFFFAAILFLWMNPQYTPGRSERSEKIVLARISFVFGPYPSKAQIIQLKKENFTGIISLLHPAVVPFEPKLISEEDAAASEAGIEIIHTPMLPWVSQNIASIETIKKILSGGKGKYYVHCYLGKDRVNVVRRIIESQNVATDASNINTYRTLNEIHKFAGGPLFYLGKAVYLLPHPTEEECLGYLLSGYVKHVVSLIDNSSAQNLEMIKKDSALYAAYAMEFSHLPFDGKNFDYTKLHTIIDSLKHFAKPLVLLVKTTDQKETLQLVQAIKSTFALNTPELENILQPEKIERLFPNIFYGPLPNEEQKKELYSKGIQNLLALALTPTLSPSKNENGISVFVKKDNGKLDSLLSGGTWYLCGAPREQTVKRFSYSIEKR